MFKTKALVVLAIMACWMVAGADVVLPLISPQGEADTSVAAAPAAPAGSLKRAVFTSGVIDREPVDEIDSLATDSTRVFFFTEIMGMEGRTVTHRWMYGGENKAEVPFAVGGPRWRVHSSKNLVPEWTGKWTVDVLDDAGNMMGQEGFVYYARE
ncbi:MAG: DUF2914 domain-containing protein [Candidatus Krumholzibacteria bacterium]